jgi:hypothetical protein
MRRFTALFHRSSTPPRRTVPVRPVGVEETICAPKPLLRRCLNEGAHKGLR